MEDTVEEDLYAKLLGGPGAFGAEFGQGFPLLVTRAFEKYFEAVILLGWPVILATFFAFAV